MVSSIPLVLSPVIGPEDLANHAHLTATVVVEVERFFDGRLSLRRSHLIEYSEAPDWPALLYLAYALRHAFSAWINLKPHLN